MPKLNLSKPVITRCGLPARVLATDARRSTPVVGLVFKDGIEQAWFWNVAGETFGNGIKHEMDIVNSEGG